MDDKPAPITNKEAFVRRAKFLVDLYDKGEISYPPCAITRLTDQISLVVWKNLGELSLSVKKEWRGIPCSQSIAYIDVHGDVDELWDVYKFYIDILKDGKNG